jgi:hypothetical protein
MKYLGITITLVGGIFLLGTAGLSDQNLITFEEMVNRILASMTAIGVGILLTRIANQLETIKRRKARRK